MLASFSRMILTVCSLWAGHWNLNLTTGVLEGVREEEGGTQETRRLLRTHWLPINVNKQVLKFDGQGNHVCHYKITVFILPNEGYTVGLQREGKNHCQHATQSRTPPALFSLPKIFFQLTVAAFSRCERRTLFSTRAAASTIGQERDQARSRNSSKLRECSCRANGVTLDFLRLKQAPTIPSQCQTGVKTRAKKLSIHVLLWWYLDPICSCLFVPQMETISQHLQLDHRLKRVHQNIGQIFKTGTSVGIETDMTIYKGLCDTTSSVSQPLCSLMSPSTSPKMSSVFVQPIVRGFRCVSHLERRYHRRGRGCKFYLLTTERRRDP